MLEVVAQERRAGDPDPLDLKFALDHCIGVRTPRRRGRRGSQSLSPTHAHRCQMIDRLEAIPPSTVTIVPDTSLARSDARKTIKSATSRTCAGRPKGYRFTSST